MTGSRSWDSPAPPARSVAAFTALGALLAIPGLIATFLRIVPPSDDATALVAAFISYGLFGYALALLCFGIALVTSRRKAALAVVTAVLAGLLALQLSWLAPLFVPDDRPATSRSFTVFSLNLYQGLAEPQEVAQQAARADVVILVEATPEALQALKAFDWDARFPYSVGDANDDGVSDTAIYSRFPLSDSASLPPTSFQQYVTTVSVPDLGDVRVISAHPCNPYCGFGRWASEHAVLRAAVQENLRERLLVAGDFNAVDDHGPIRALVRDGLTSATDIVGAGWLPTYPANRTLPPLLPIDHVMVNDRLTATSISTVRIKGTDHRGLVATIAGAS
jgi:endonuclease/exonuclease/phosphatase (EEP) superfamily protein YafD